MSELAPADFYTGIVVDVYGPLRGSVPDPSIYKAFISTWGGPALELGCGDGDPLLTLRAAGIDVEGLDSSADMLAKLRANAAATGLDVTVHHTTIEEMDLARRYRSIFLAGPTFNLLPDDATALRALERIRLHLDPDGAALVPLFIPEPVAARHLGHVRRHADERGRVLSVIAISTERDESAKRQTTMLRYEVADGDDRQVVERPWVLHWYGRREFGVLATEAGLRVEAIVGADGSIAAADETQFSFVLRRDDAARGDGQK